MEQLIVRLFLALFALEFLVEFGLNELNLRYVRARWNERKIPDFFQGKIDAREYDKSVQYTLAKGKFQRWAEIYGRLVALWVLFSGLLPLLDLGVSVHIRFSTHHGYRLSNPHRTAFQQV